MIPDCYLAQAGCGTRFPLAQAALVGEQGGRRPVVLHHVSVMLVMPPRNGTAAHAWSCISACTHGSTVS